MQYARAVVPAAREFVHGAGGGVPNQGVVMSYVYAWYAVAGLARTAAARDLKPTFPYWQADPGGPWRVPPDGQNPALTALSAHPLPEGDPRLRFLRQPGAIGPARSGHVGWGSPETCRSCRRPRSRSGPAMGSS